MRRKTIGSISLAAIIATAPVAAFAATSSTGEYGQWGLDMSDQRNGALNGSYTYDATGAGVRVYVVDTGIDAGHGDLGGRVVGGYNAVDGSGSTADCNGHGTHMAGLVAGRGYGIAKGATLVPVRVQACDYTSSTQRYVAGIDWMVANHQAGTPAVANMSFDENPNSMPPSSAPSMTASPWSSPPATRTRATAVTTAPSPQPATRTRYASVACSAIRTTARSGTRVACREAASTCSHPPTTSPATSPVA